MNEAWRMAIPIEDYAFIGDCQTAALIARNGSIDWLYFPRFDSAACFAALLGGPEHGRWRIAPVAEVRAVHRRYRNGTLILETLYETGEGTVTLVDCMPLRTAQPDLVRLVVGERGQVRLRMDLCIRFDYGSLIPWVRREDGGIIAVAGPDTLPSSTPPGISPKFAALQRIAVRADIITRRPAVQSLPACPLRLRRLQGQAGQGSISICKNDNATFTACSTPSP